jgi:hypothetical protein
MQRARWPADSGSLPRSKNDECFPTQVGAKPSAITKGSTLPLINRQLEESVIRESYQKARGLTDSEIESHSSKILLKFPVAWAAWESERTGFGQGFRSLMHIPSFLPLMFSSDHYVDHLTALRTNEVQMGVPFYFTWNPTKSQLLRQCRRGVFLIQHPWLSLNARKNFSSKPTRGTLFFYPHIHGSLRVHVDLEQLRVELESLPREYHPVTIAVSSQCVDEGVHTTLRSLGFPITTVGNMLDQAFPQLFYALMSHFRFTAGLSIGSHAYYSLEAGVPHLLLNNRVACILEIEEPLGSGSWRPHRASDDYPDVVTQSVQKWFVEALQERSSGISEPVSSFVDAQFGKAARVARITLVSLGYGAMLLRPLQTASLVLRAVCSRRR